MIQHADRPAHGQPADGPAEERERKPFEDHVAGIAGHVSRLMHIWALRARVRTQRLVVLVLAAVVAGIALCVFSFQAARLVVSGLTQGIAELAGGRAWVGELAAGVLILCGIAASLLAIRGWSERRLLKGLGSRHDESS